MEMDMMAGVEDVSISDILGIEQATWNQQRDPAKLSKFVLDRLNRIGDLGGEL